MPCSSPLPQPSRPSHQHSLRELRNPTTNPPAPTQLRTRPACPTHPLCLHPSLHRLRPSRPRQHPRALQHLGPRHHRHLPRRLFRHFNGRARYEFPIQHLGRADVSWERAELFGDGAVVRETGWGGVERVGANGLCGRAAVGGVSFFPFWLLLFWSPVSWLPIKASGTVQYPGSSSHFLSRLYHLPSLPPISVTSTYPTPISSSPTLNPFPTRNAITHSKRTC